MHFGRSLAKSGRWEVFVAAFYIDCVLILLFACSFGYVFMLVSKKQKVPKLLSLTLNAFGLLMVSVLMHPAVDLLAAMSSCERRAGKLVMRRFPDVECFRGFHLVGALVSYLWLAAFTGLIGLFSLLNYEPFVNRGHPTSRGSSFCFLYLNLCIVGSILAEALDPGSDSPFFSLCCYLACATFLVFQFHLHPPFYARQTSKLWSGVALFNWWTYLLLFLAALLHREAPNVFPYWLLGGLSICAFVCVRRTNFTEALQTHTDAIGDARTLLLHLQALLELVTTQSAAHEQRLSGYVQYHKKHCADAACPLRSDNTLRRNKLELSSYEQYINLKYGAISNFVTYQFKQGLQKHPESLELRVLYCFYLIEVAKNTQQALDQLALCLHSPLLTLQGLYAVERLKKLVLQEAMSSQDRVSRDILLSSNNDVNRRIRRLLEDISVKMVEFWGSFLKETPDMRRVMQLCKKVRSLDSELDGLMEQEAAKETLEPDIWRQFASFQEIIMMDESRAERVYQHIKTVKSAKAAQAEYDQIIKKNEELSKFASPIIFISGMKVGPAHQDDFCRIVNINNAASLVFGFSKTELIGKKIETLMSDIYANLHDRFVSNYISSMKGLMINKERFVMAKHKSKYLVPLTIYIKAVEDVSMQTLHFMAFLRPEKMTSCKGYILISDSGSIVDISMGVQTVLGLGPEEAAQDKTIANWVASAQPVPHHHARPRLHQALLHACQAEIRAGDGPGAIAERSEQPDA